MMTSNTSGNQILSLSVSQRIPGEILFKGGQQSGKNKKRKELTVLGCWSKELRTSFSVKQHNYMKQNVEALLQGNSLYHIVRYLS